MYRTVVDVALIEAAQRIAPLVRACRDEGERERRLPAQVLAAMHEARLFLYIAKALEGLEIDPIMSMTVVEEIGTKRQSSRTSIAPALPQAVVGRSRYRSPCS